MFFKAFLSLLSESSKWQLSGRKTMKQVELLNSLSLARIDCVTQLDLWDFNSDNQAKPTTFLHTF